MTTVAFGWNQNHQLGLGDSEIRVVPQVVTALEGSVIVQIACGSRYSVALSKEGNVYSWGRGKCRRDHEKGACWLVARPGLGGCCGRGSYRWKGWTPIGEEMLSLWRPD